jgi:hypothetical protein
MDHAQGRSFHHHLARAIVHLNFLAGLLPFFEPSIEYEDPLNEYHPRAARPNPDTRGLHTFVPRPAPSSPPTLASHGGIPSTMVIKPEPLLRPLSITPAPREEPGHHPPEGVRLTPAPAVGTSSSTPVVKPPKWGVPGPDYPRATTRTTTPVPVRSKQRAHPVDAPQPKKKQRVDSSAPESAADPPPLPVAADSPPTGLNSDDSDEEVPPRYRTIDSSATATSLTTTNPVPVPAPPPATSTTGEPTHRSNEAGDNPTVAGPWYYPWTDKDDKELVSLKNDTKSRPSWKTIGARLRRDPQVCKMRWAALKQMPEHQHRELPSHEPEAED